MMSAAQATFYYLAAASVAGALLEVTRKSPVHSMLWVLALFLLLRAEFLAAVQVIVYACTTGGSRGAGAAMMPATRSASR